MSIFAEITELLHPTYYRLPFTEDDVNTFHEHKNCPACRSSLPPRKLVELGRPDWTRRVALVECSECGMIYYKNPPTADFMNRFYAEQWNAKRGEIASDKINAPTTIAPRMLKMARHAGLTNKTASIFDLGCGTGSALAAFSQAGFTDVYGVEPAGYRATVSERRFPDRISKGGYESIETDLKFDVIFSNHVLEHVHNPADAFAWMMAHLAHGGFILVCVPNSLEEPTINQALFLPHLHSFSARALLALGRNNGCEAMFWRGHRRDEFCMLFFRAEAAPTFDQAQFWTTDEYLSQLRSTDQGERIRSVWLDSSPYVTWSLTSGLSDERQQRRSYATITAAQRVGIKASDKIARALTALGASTLAKHSVVILKWLSRPGHQIVSWVCLDIRRRRIENDAPIVGFADGAGFLVK